MPLLDLLYPRLCASCGAHGRIPLCDACERNAPWIGEACRRCALPRCRGCSGLGFVFDAAASAAVYEGPIRDALIRFKVAGEFRAASALARRLAPAARTLGVPAGAVVTWVPSGRASLRQRGRNPAELLARPLASMLFLPAGSLLRKRTETRDLAGLTKPQRRDALRGAFDTTTAPVPDHVLLVDDVLTTGATANECAATLKRGGAVRVDVVTFARAL